MDNPGGRLDRLPVDRLLRRVFALRRRRAFQVGENRRNADAVAALQLVSKTMPRAVV